MIEYGTRARTRSICDEPRRHRAAQEQHPRGLATLEAVYYYAVPSLLPTAYFLLIPTIGYSYCLQYIAYWMPIVLPILPGTARLPPIYCMSNACRYIYIQIYCLLMPTVLPTAYCLLRLLVLRLLYCLLPTAYCLLPTAYSYSYCLLPIAYCLLPPLLPTAYCLLPTAYCLLPTAYCLLFTAYCLLLPTTAYCLLPILPTAYTAYCLLPTAYCLLPTTAYCLLLPTAHCPLPTAYCLLLPNLLPNTSTY